MEENKVVEVQNSDAVHEQTVAPQGEHVETPQEKKKEE